MGFQEYGFIFESMKIPKMSFSNFINKYIHIEYKIIYNFEYNEKNKNFSGNDF
jgi:hypothetical protein